MASSVKVGKKAEYVDKDEAVAMAKEVANKNKPLMDKLEKL